MGGSKYPKNEVSIYESGKSGNGKGKKVKEVKTCREYKYLGITLNREGTDDQKISNRIIKADNRMSE